MLCFGTKPVVRFRNGNANIKGEMLALIQAINPREPSGGSSCYLKSISDNLVLLRHFMWPFSVKNISL